MKYAYSEQDRKWSCVLSRCGYIATLNIDFEEKRALSTPLGDKIRELRKAKGLTLDKLAEQASSSKSYIWELENKNPPRPSADKIAKIAAVLGVTADYLFYEDTAIDVNDAKDEAFFRKYRQMDPAVKAKIQKMIRLIGDDDT